MPGRNFYAPAANCRAPSGLRPLFPALLHALLRVLPLLDDARGLQVFQRDVRRLINADPFESDPHAQANSRNSLMSAARQLFEKSFVFVLRQTVLINEIPSRKNLSPTMPLDKRRDLKQFCRREVSHYSTGK